MTLLEQFVGPSLRARIRAMLPPRQQVMMRAVLKGFSVPRWGNLRRLRPISDNYGFERGTPVDRYYLERFFSSHRDVIRGHVLEIQQPIYTRLFGERVSLSETLDISADMQPTYRCDLADAQDCVPADRFDCFLLPNTLCVLRNIERALAQALRAVRPGGTILATTAATCVPLVTDYPDYWRMSADGWREVTARAWPGCEVEVRQYGNLVTAMAALQGIAAEELSAEELDAYDARYPVLVTIRCRKPG